jgi:hypothetical protein
MHTIQGGETTSSTRLPLQSKKPKTRRLEVSFIQLQKNAHVLESKHSADTFHHFADLYNT